MTHEEINKLIDGFATGENAEQVATVRTEIDGLFQTIDTANALHEEDQKKIATLNDTNMKLFLRVTGNAPEDPEPEKEETLSDFVSKIASNRTEKEEENNASN